MRKKYKKKVLIVGAGLAGSTIARILAENDVLVDIIEKYNALIKTNVIITAKTVLDFYKNNTLIMNSIINVFTKHNENMKSLIGIEYSFGSYKNYITTIKHLKNYIKKIYNANDISLTQINYNFIYNFSQFILLNTESGLRLVFKGKACII